MDWRSEVVTVLRGGWLTCSSGHHSTRHIKCGRLGDVTKLFSRKHVFFWRNIFPAFILLNRSDGATPSYVGFLKSLPAFRWCGFLLSEVWLWLRFQNQLARISLHILGDYLKGIRIVSISFEFSAILSFTKPKNVLIMFVMIEQSKLCDGTDNKIIYTRTLAIL